MDFIDDNEIWKVIPEYKGKYEVSNHGRVKSNYRFFGKKKVYREWIFKGGLTTGYPHVLLTSEYFEKRKNVKVHRLVAQMFIDNPLKKPQVNHKDGNPENNHVDNLEWCSSAENVRHSLVVLGRGNAKLKAHEVREIRVWVSEGMENKDIALAYSISRSIISLIRTGSIWKHV